MSKKIETLNKEEIAQIHGGAGELSARYLKLAAESTKNQSGEIGAKYLALVSESTK